VRGARRVLGVVAEAGELRGRVAAAVHRRGERPAVGDWVVLGPEQSAGERVVVALLPRRTAFARRGTGQREEGQVVAANVDDVFVVTDVATDLNLRRLERYMALCWASGATPTIVLNKIDLAAAPDEVLARVRPVAAGAEVVLVSARSGQGLDELERLLAPRRTVALLGSSGVGKSTLVNRLVGREVSSTAEVRERDGRGRHTTTRRELLMLPSGAMVVDTPGLRELGMWDSDGGVSAAFEDIEDVARACRFRDCTHATEPGCAVRAAVDRGELDAARARSYGALRRELVLHDERRVEAKRRGPRRGRRRDPGRHGGNEGP
jgi:ribosome biogenesis GTPase